MKKKLVLLLLTVVLTFSLGGCDYKDIDRRRFVVSMGLDPVEDKKIRVILKTGINKGGDSKSKTTTETYMFYETTSTNISEALRYMKNQFFLEPDFSHLKSIILGEDFFDEHDSSTFLNMFIKRRDFQNIAYVAAGSPSAKEILYVQQADETIPGSTIFLKFGQGNTYGRRFSMKAYELYIRSKTPTNTITLPIIKKIDDKLVFNGYAFYHGEHFEKKVSLKKNLEARMYGLLDKGLSQGFLILSENPSKGVGVEEGKAKIKLYNEGDTIKCMVNIHLTITSEGVDVQRFGKKRLENDVKKHINTLALTVLQNLQKEKVDPLLLGVKYWSTHPSYELTDDWLENDYQKIEFNVQTKVKWLQLGSLD